MGAAIAAVSAAVSFYFARASRNFAHLGRKEERWGAYVQALVGLREAQNAMREGMARMPNMQRFVMGESPLKDPEVQRLRANVDAARQRVRQLVPTVPGLSADRRTHLAQGPLNSAALAAAIREAEEELQQVQRDLYRRRPKPPGA